MVNFQMPRSDFSLFAAARVKNTLMNLEKKAPVSEQEFADALELIHRYWEKPRMFLSANVALAANEELVLRFRELARLQTDYLEKSERAWAARPNPVVRTPNECRAHRLLVQATLLAARAVQDFAKVLISDAPRIVESINVPHSETV